MAAKGSPGSAGAGARKGHVALVRPDKFVYALTPAAQLGRAIQQALDVFGKNATAAKGGSPSDLHVGAQTPVSA